MALAHAEYVNGPIVRTAHQVPSGRMLTIALVNSGTERLPQEDRDALLDEVGRLALEWLRARSLLVPATLVSVHLSREVDLKVVNWGWGGGGQELWVGEDLRLTPERPSA